MPLPQGSQWKLQFHDSWSYVWAPGQTTTWCAKIFSQSLWQTPQGALYVKKIDDHADPGNATSILLLEEHSLQYDIFPVTWPDVYEKSVVGLPMHARLLKLRAPRGAATYFWQLADFQDAGCFATPALRDSKWLSRKMRQWKKCSWL